jgi:arginine/lysine/ornithine decarboxylase
MSLDNYEEHDGTTEKHERRITRCRSCNQQIVFLKTATGKNMPVDADTVEPSDDLFDRSRHKSHFATCPKADKHRKARS